MPSGRWTIEPHLRVVLLTLILLTCLPHLNPVLPWSGGLIGLAVGIGLAYRKSRPHAPQGQGPVFWLYAILHHANLVLLLTLGGLFLGFVVQPLLGYPVHWLLFSGALVASLVLSTLLQFTGRLQPPTLRAGVVFAVGALATAALLYACERPDLTGLEIDRVQVGLAALLAAVAGFFFSVVSSSEQTEGDCAVVAVFLGIGLWLLVPPTMRIVALVFPLALYVGYTLFLQKQLAALKWTLRGLSRQRVGRLAPALAAYRRALLAAPGYKPAESGLWDIHRNLNLQDLIHNAELMQMLDFDLCLDRARRLLLGDRTPSASQVEDARKLLRLVEENRPERSHEVNYWRAVADAHAGDLDAAATLLKELLDERKHPPADAPYRDPILTQAWHLALIGHAGLRQRVGDPLLAAGRRLDAIAGVEKTLAKTASDSLALTLKQFLYPPITLAEYVQEAGSDPLRAALHFDHGFCYDLGKPLLEDPAQWRRGMELWQIAARGKPDRAPSLLRHVAEVARYHGDTTSVNKLQSAVVAVGRSLGVSALAPQACSDYFATVKELADTAYAAGDRAKALEDYQLYSEHAESGADTLRRIAELQEARGDVPAALIANARCLVYDARHPLHLQRRDQYYISLTPDELRARWEQLQSAFDLNYCLTQARLLLDHPQAGPEQVDWALHLLLLAEVAAPDHISRWVLLGRARQLRGEIHLAQALYEKAYQQGKAVAPDGETEEDWLLACRLLGDIYLNDGFPERAIPCFGEYRKSAKSGAATVYKMGIAYERLGDAGRAAKCFENVAFYNNALADEARQALRRVQGVSGKA